MKQNFIGLAHICVFTTNMSTSLDFYTKVLFFEKEYETIVKDDPDNHIHYILIRLGNCAIELLEPQKKNSPIGIGVVEHFALEVKNLNDVVEHVKKAGVTIKSDICEMPKLFNGCRGSFIYGPSRELIELFELY